MIRQTSTSESPQRTSRPAGADALVEMASLWLDGVARPALGTMSDLVGRMVSPSRSALAEEEDCAAALKCHPRDCTCDCCIGDADIELYTELGETRIVPLVISNERSSPRRIVLELCEPIEWPKVRVLGPTEFELKPCEKREVLLEVTASAPPDAAGHDRDVTSCQVAYAELCIRGCDVRSLRLAIAVLPRHCLAYHVRCFCECC
jgi:hypothetical protein